MQRADKRKYHYIYKITRDDGKYYVGMHSTDDLEDGYFGSGQRISRSIKKHGKGRHTKRILEFLPTRDSLKQRERELITEELRADPMCMNIAPGGGGGKISDENQRARSSAGGKTGGKKTGAVNGGRALSRAHAEGKVRYDTFTGRKHSEETKRKMREAHALRKQHAL